MIVVSMQELVNIGGSYPWDGGHLVDIRKH